MRWGWVAIACLLAGPAVGQQVVREGTTTPVDLTFVNLLGVDELPTSLTYRLDDRASRIELIDDTTIASPASQPCPGSPAGCVTVTLPASSMKMVGQCSNKQKYCLVDGDCGSGATCRVPNEATQDRVLSVQWTFTGGQGQDRVVLRMLNLEHLGN